MRVWRLVHIDVTSEQRLLGQKQVCNLIRVRSYHILFSLFCIIQ